MNILPKKRWHVRSKDNITRVRKDEAKAKEYLNLMTLKQKKNEKEICINTLRYQSKYAQQLPAVNGANNVEIDKEFSITKLFDSKNCLQKTNDAWKIEQERLKIEYEKKVGFLCYLGQSKDEPIQNIWYDKRNSVVEINTADELAKNVKNKDFLDPIRNFPMLRPTDKFHQKINNNLKSHKKKLQNQSVITKESELRRKRLLRETAEQLRQQNLLSRNS